MKATERLLISLRRLVKEEEHHDSCPVMKLLVKMLYDYETDGVIDGFDVEPVSTPCPFNKATF